MKEDIKSYFILDAIIPLDSRRSVEFGIHGLEQVDDEYYATHYHLKKYLAKGRMIGFLNSIHAKDLYNLAVNTNSDFSQWPKIKYRGDHYKIQKYKLSWLIKLMETHSQKLKKENKLTIGLFNFRRFGDFQEIKMKGITYFVGKNNSGKSTVVKALILVLDYLQNQQGKTFSFAKSSLNDANIVTYDRAVNKTLNAPTVEFEVAVGEVKSRIVISGLPNSTDALVRSLELTDLRKKNKLTINYLEKTIRLEFNFSEQYKRSFNLPFEENRVGIELFDSEIERITKLLNEEKNPYSKEHLKLREELNFVKGRRNEYVHLHGLPEKADRAIHTNRDRIKAIELQTNSRYLNRTEIPALGKMAEFIHACMQMINSDDYMTSIKHFDLSEQEKDGIKSLRSFSSSFTNLEFGNLYLESLQNLFDHFSNDQCVYLGANPSKQSALFNIRDRGNALAQAIHEYHQLRIEEGDKELIFIRRWMKEFEVGDDFKIEIRAGEAYEVQVIEKNAKGFEERINLSDKGMGSLQVMMLLFRLATLMRANIDESKRVHILVEEPELNLHPRLQSKLTELFHKVHEDYGFNFIIETHSEYMIRKSQILVKDLNQSENKVEHPFKVYYFDAEKGPYEMRYRDDGIFIDDFGPGFYDVASQHSINLLARKR
jgi:predicted ATPase